MPSDCQCSTACETVIKTKVISNREATRRLKRLEDEVANLKGENIRLKTRLKRTDISKKEIIADLKNHLNKI